MKYGRIAGGDRINTSIYRCFEYITEENARKFVRKFEEQPHDQPQVMHTFRELVLGAFLAREGLPVRYDPVIDGKTPDWCIQDSALRGLIELVNFHIDQATENAINRDIQAKGIWVGWLGSNVDRLYDRIWDKASGYKDLVQNRGIPYMVAVFGGFEANVRIEEVQQCLLDNDHGLFEVYRSLSGVTFFDELGGQYTFTYIPNPVAERACQLPSGIFDLHHHG